MNNFPGLYYMTEGFRSNCTVWEDGTENSQISFRKYVAACNKPPLVIPGIKYIYDEQAITEFILDNIQFKDMEWML